MPAPEWDTNFAEKIAALADATATSNSVNRNYFMETSQSVVNTVNVAIAPAFPTSLDPTPTTTYATATDDASVATFGVQETPIVITLLATIDDAGALAQYLIRSVPAYWFSNLAISLNTLSDANKEIVANLEIGQQIAVTKTFPAGVVPQTVTEYLFVEGISHNITVESHVVTIYTGPASTYLQWVLGNYTTTQTRTNILTNPNFEVSVNGWNTSNTSVARVTTDSYLGVASMSIGITVAATDARVGQTQNWDAIAGVTYTGSVYLKNTAGNNRQMNVSLRYVNSGGVTISEIFGTAQSTTVGGAWTRFTVTGLAPALTTNADLLIYPNTTNASLTNVTLADAALVEVSGSALPYFDGTYVETYTGYTLTYQAWNGTANTSTSTTVWGLNSSGTGSALGDTTYGLA